MAPQGKPGRNAEICRLREELGWSYSRIGRRMGVSTSTVSYHCLRLFAEHPSKPPGVSHIKPGSVLQRGNHLVRRFTPEQDAALLALTAQGLNPSAVGRALEPRREPNTVCARLATLARLQARAEDLADA